MKNNEKQSFADNAKVFQHILEHDINPSDLRKDLVELYANYSRMVIQFYDKGQGVVPLGDHYSQLYSLMQLIAVLDIGSANPLFGELNTADHQVYRKGADVPLAQSA